MPKEGPILFSGPMVRAILDNHKWKTRRIVKPDLASGFDVGRGYEDSKAGYPFVEDEYGDFYRATDFCPYGKPSDLLWVRETFGPGLGDNHTPALGYVAYRADGEYPARLKDTHVWRPSIFMPRWASRITLCITEVRVERLQDISEEDAIAEGITGPHDVGYPAFRVPGDSKPRYSSAKSAFTDLWDSINADRGYGWDVNPWVWAISFERVSPNPISDVS
jgi:hypothetical protein